MLKEHFVYFCTGFLNILIFFVPYYFNGMSARLSGVNNTQAIGKQILQNLGFKIWEFLIDIGKRSFPEQSLIDVCKTQTV